MNASNPKRRLPIGIQTFREIREEGHYYVDKTGFALRLVSEGKHFFLSRPRRFGKSLFLDTLKELFEGSRELFAGLEADGGWNWSLRHPVVRLSFGRGNYAEPGYLRANLMAQLDSIDRQAGLKSRYPSGPDRFAFLLERLHLRNQQRVAVLVDEYDKPILDTLEDPSIARSNRDYLRGLYSAIKDSDEHVRFCFLTGVSKFSKVSLFSGLNNLIDITLEPEYSSICGYTEQDLDTVFAPELEGLDRTGIREWYDGYTWGGPERVYNPFDVLLLFRKRTFEPWWFESGSPTFLIDTLVRRGVQAAALDGMVASERQLGTFDVGGIATEALLFQTGYLTLGGSERRRGRRYHRLVYPNREVRQSLNESLADALTGDVSKREADCDRLEEVLRTADFDGLELLLRSVLAGVPYQWHSGTPIARYEGYYATVLYTYFQSVTAHVTAEDSSSAGRLDLAVRAYGRVYLLELKVQERAGPRSAMDQLKARGYAEKYHRLGEPVYLLGLEFSERTRNLARFDVEAVRST